MADVNTILNIPCVGCELETGFQVSCVQRTVSGNDTLIYITDKCNIESYDDNYTNNIIDDINLKPGAVWYTIQGKIDGVVWTETFEPTTGGATQTLTFNTALIAEAVTIDEGAQIVLDFLNTITNPYSNFVVVVSHNAGFRRVFGLLGIRGMKMASGTQGDSGALITDNTAGYTVVLASVSTIPAPVLHINAALPII